MAKYEITPAQAENLRAMDVAVEEIKRVLDRFDQAGLPQPELRRKYEQMVLQRQGLLATFAPGATRQRGGRA